jgi:hypothetical protein
MYPIQAILLYGFLTTSVFLVASALLEGVYVHIKSTNEKGG